VLVTFVEPFETRRGSCVDVVRCGDFVFAAIELVVSVVVDIGVVENVAAIEATRSGPALRHHSPAWRKLQPH
jgi:acetaldehyde dehydrogenase (acetylating)